MKRSRVLIISLSNLGDAILTYPAIQALHEAHPDAELHVLASARTIGLFQSDPRFTKVWLWEKRAAFLKQLSLLGSLFLERYQVVVDFRNSLIPLFLLGARRTPVNRGFLDRGMHRVDFHLKLLEKIGIAPLNKIGTLLEASLFYGPAEEKEAAQWVKPGGRCVVVAPGARSHLKRWSAQRFAAVADRLSREHQSQIILVGGQEDQPTASAVKSAMREEALDLTGKTTLPQLAALLAKAKLVVTNDSACLHAAQAQGVPTVAIFGPTDEKKYGPRPVQEPAGRGRPRPIPSAVAAAGGSRTTSDSPKGLSSVVVRRSLVCAPCERALCQYNHECMTGLEAQEVYAAAVKVMKGS